jgi:hypothetical protein
VSGDAGVARRLEIGDEETYTVSDLAQVRVLADPFRLKLLGAFGETPRTTMQVAQLIGEKPTKLYHHVLALVRVGLLALKETRANRGTQEKYYQAVATRFQIGRALFSTGARSEASPDAAAAVLLSILDTTRAELMSVLNRAGAGSESCDRKPAVVARMLLGGTREHIEQFRARLLALVDEFKAEAAAEQSGAAATFALTLAFYPLSVPGPRPAEAAGAEATTTALERSPGSRGAGRRRRSAGASDPTSVTPGITPPSSEVRRARSKVPSATPKSRRRGPASQPRRRRGDLS